MEFIEVLRTRRSGRNYTGEPLTDEEMAILREAVLRSPSSRSLNPWEFVFVQNRETLRDLSRCKAHGASFLADAALGVVICGDEARCDVWIEDCSIAALIVHLSAQNLGLGSCWIQVRKRFHADGRLAESVVRETIGVPGRLQVLAMVAIGRPDRALPGHDTSKLAWDRIHNEQYTGEI
ncbi:MAG: NAD(P)H-dependent dehydrogenase/reductase [Deltaproteobacteria bacterium]|nr:NAD(P)H-dependent dehydrogenase/reductase [Deltaproteobacteria bacterium]